ncbi:right-handed parallel beta-helix repeat-containing protein [Aureibaculum sp. A20]|uniref:Right-handed parallel beta-helix repeat-containing protein n=1 Tax=Aureibaculum flavum TaxID=2795986 RepID=A0ABS0WQ24_9FLAO|nr:right-handed parallel beta-helix repeat-containing protein [Aureibaculum flavum]MBJ2174089.1 right-handed parallel beta-helix repeat-containing protein [Aureibaculum flavum]
MNKTITLLLLFSVSMLFSQSNYYVGIDGDNSNEGSKKRPWKTVQFGIDQLFPGDTLNIYVGVYNEKLTVNRSGSKDNRIVIRGEKNAVIDATGIDNSQNAILKIENQSFITVTNLELANNIHNYAQGIFINGASTDITISHCNIHDIHFSNNPKKKANPERNAQGIIVHGSNSEISITNLLIESNELYDCRLGYSEGIAVSGNVDGFVVKNNKVHDLTNIGIDIVGHEKVCNEPLKDQARNGVISNNVVYNCVSPYANSAGIYVDGGQNLEISNNTTFGNGYGIEIGCENKDKSADSITVRNNVIYKNEIAGISVGGFNYPESGKVTKSSFYNNTLFHNTMSSKSIAEVYISYNEGLDFENNIIYSDKSGKTIFGNLSSTNVVIDYNLYYSASKNIFFDWNTKWCVDLLSFQEETGLDKFSNYQNPNFLNGDEFDFHLKDTSPAINRGNSEHVILKEEKDIDGQLRIIDAIIDIGADEYN